MYVAVQCVGAVGLFEALVGVRVAESRGGGRGSGSGRVLGGIIRSVASSRQIRVCAGVVVVHGRLIVVRITILVGFFVVAVSFGYERSVFGCVFSVRRSGE